MKKNIALSISLIIFLTSLTHFTFIIDIPYKALAQMPTSTNDTYHFVKEFGSYGVNNGQFSFPDGISLDSADNVYVTDSGNYRIQKFDSNGNFITKWGSFGSDNGQFDGPAGIALDSSGKVYVTDIDEIQLFAQDNTILPTNDKENVDGNVDFTRPDKTNPDDSKDSDPQSPAGITDQV